MAIWGRKDAEKLATDARLNGQMREVWLVYVTANPTPSYKQLSEVFAISRTSVYRQMGRARHLIALYYKAQGVESPAESESGLSIREEAEQLWDAMSGPRRGDPGHCPDPVEGDRDTVYASYPTLDDFVKVVEYARTARLERTLESDFLPD